MLATHLFGERSAEFFGTFHASFFTMIQFVSGDGWASVSRSIFEEQGEMDSKVATFFATYYLVASVTLLNVVVAVLLDEFVQAVSQEKEHKEERRRQARAQELHTGVIDPVTRSLVEYEDDDDLNARIDAVYMRLDTDGDDDAGGLTFTKFQRGLKKMDIHMTQDEWEILTDHGKLTDANDMFDMLRFRSIMKGELWRFMRRELLNAINLGCTDEFRVNMMQQKLFDSKLSQHLLDIKASIGVNDALRRAGSAATEGCDGAEEVERTRSMLMNKHAESVQELKKHFDHQMALLEERLAARATSDASLAGKETYLGRVEVKETFRERRDGGGEVEEESSGLERAGSYSQGIEGNDRVNVRARTDALLTSAIAKGVGKGRGQSVKGMTRLTRKQRLTQRSVSPARKMVTNPAHHTPGATPATDGKGDSLLNGRDAGTRALVAGPSFCEMVALRCASIAGKLEGLEREEQGAKSLPLDPHTHAPNELILMPRSRSKMARSAPDLKMLAATSVDLQTIPRLDLVHLPTRDSQTNGVGAAATLTACATGMNGLEADENREGQHSLQHSLLPTRRDSVQPHGSGNDVVLLHSESCGAWRTPGTDLTSKQHGHKHLDWNEQKVASTKFNPDPPFGTDGSRWQHRGLTAKQEALPAAHAPLVSRSSNGSSQLCHQPPNNSNDDPHTLIDYTEKSLNSSASRRGSHSTFSM